MRPKSRFQNLFTCRGAFIDVEPRVERVTAFATTLSEREWVETPRKSIHVPALLKSLEPSEARPNPEPVSDVDTLATSVHRIHNIATELLKFIFSHLMDDATGMTCHSVSAAGFMDSLDTKTGVWTVSHVCRRWRGIALDTSSLWSTVGLSFDNYRNVSVAADILAVYLERSKQHALDVIVHSKVDISDHAVLHLLMDTCKRWRGGWLALPLATFLEWKTPFPFRMLKELRICTRHRPELLSAALEEDSMLRCRAFRDAPRLKDVAVDNHFIFCDLFEVDWATVHLFRQEKRLSAWFVECYPNFDILSALIILCKASSLKMAQFNFQPFNEDHEFQWLNRVDVYRHILGRGIRNVSLRSLVLKGATESWTRLLSKIHLPNLQTLHYLPRSRDELFPDPLSVAAGRSLRKLVVHVVDDTDITPIKEFLEKTPGLIELRMIFEDCFDIGSMFTSVFRMTPDLQLLPRLSSLTVTTRPPFKIIITEEFIMALKGRVDGQGLFQTPRLELKIAQAELIMTTAVQHEFNKLFCVHV